MNDQFTRRNFLKSTGAGIGAAMTVPAILSARSPNETVRIAAAGVGGKGWTDVNGAARHKKIVAYCDVDTGSNRRGGFGAAAEKWPDAKGYTDFRKLIESQHKTIDAITVSTPDGGLAPYRYLLYQQLLPTGVDHCLIVESSEANLDRIAQMQAPVMHLRNDNPSPKSVSVGWERRPSPARRARRLDDRA